uniref:Uncharacterized protein n=1 Tax=Cucumis melo TaxID=3656 RepID=A0A9I9D9P9_CUCME
MSLFLKSCSSKKFVGDHSLEKEEYVEKGKSLVKWKMPKVPIHKIYEERRKNHFFIFPSKNSDPSIETTEAHISFGNKGGFFRLFNQTPPSDFGRFNTMNIGLVQIGVKTLTKKIPPNASIILCLRDNRIEKLEDSLIALVESNLRDGPFYFNVFPNINLSLFSAIANVVSVHFSIKGFDQIPKGCEPIAVTCRTCYKLNQNNFGSEALIESPVGKTVFFQTEIFGDNSGDVVQKVTMWDQVQLPSDWPPQLQIPTFPK